LKILDETGRSHPLEHVIGDFPEAETMLAGGRWLARALRQESLGRVS